jgi:hypothetical protein
MVTLSSRLTILMQASSVASVGRRLAGMYRAPLQLQHLLLR